MELDRFNQNVMKQYQMMSELEFLPFHFVHWNIPTADSISFQMFNAEFHCFRFDLRESSNRSDLGVNSDFDTICIKSSRIRWVQLSRFSYLELNSFLLTGVLRYNNFRPFRLGHCGVSEKIGNSGFVALFITQDEAGLQLICIRPCGGNRFIESTCKNLKENKQIRKEK